MIRVRRPAAGGYDRDHQDNLDKPEISIIGFAVLVIVLLIAAPVLAWWLGWGDL